MIHWCYSIQALDFLNRADIWQAHRKQGCRDACQIAKRYDNYNTQPAAWRLRGIWWQDVRLISE